MNGVDRTKAKRLTRVAQAAAVVLAAGAVLAFVIEPGLPAAPRTVAAEPGPAPEPATTEIRPAGIADVGFVADMLNLAGGVEPKWPETEPPPEDDGPDEPAEIPARTADTSNFRFLGGFFSDRRSLAIIAGAGKQRMVREGDEIDFGFTVASITPEAVEIERNGQTERLDREVASGAVVGTAATSAAKDDQTAPGTRVSQSARDRLENARQQAARRGAGTDRATARAEYERQRQQRIKELREQGVDVDEAEWRRDD